MNPITAALALVLGAVCRRAGGREDGGASGKGVRRPVRDAIHSPASEHKQAARALEIAARQHREAAEYHDKNMLHEARLSSASASECSAKAHEGSMSACARSAGKAQ
jgi:hypothetical protein